MRITTRRAPLAITAAALMLVPLSGTASAGSSSQYRSTGQTASATWVETGELPGGVPGNVHVGDLYVDAYSSTGADVFGYVQDYACDEGEVPGGGHHGEEPGEGFCDAVGFRFISNDDAVFTMARKNTSATLVGTLRVEGHDGGTAAAFPEVDMTWTAVGDPMTQKVTEQFSDGTFSYTYRYTSTSAQAAITGRIGAMGFTDDADDVSSGWFGSYRNMSRSRVK